MLSCFHRRGAPGRSVSARAARILWCALLVLRVFTASAQDPTNATGKVAESTAAEEALRSYLRLQEQLQGLQIKLDQSRKDTESAAERNSELLGARLQMLEQSLAAQRTRELESMQSLNRAMLIALGAFGGLGLLGMMVTAYLQWRTINRLAEFRGIAPGTHLPGSGSGLNAMGGQEKRLLHSAGAEATNLRLATTLQRLEKRLLELEHSKAPGEGTAGRTVEVIANPAGNVTKKESKTEREAGAINRIGSLLGRGQSLLNLGKPEDALACFEEALSLKANHAEALVKKGIALEQLARSEEAIKCYDRAIAADGSLTMAYLHKGALYNRMERHGEALECYERALRTQNSPGAD
jgi:tetratricopeptide (TPR) repeat protein